MIDEYPAAPRKKSRVMKWVKRLLIAAVVLGLIGGTGFVLTMKIKFADFQPPMSAPGVVVTSVGERNFVDQIEAIGTAQANQSAMLMPTVTETVKSINADEGQFVTTGTVIAELNNAEELATFSEATRSYDRYNKLARSKIGSEARRDEEEARMNVAKAQLDKRVITAPFDGVLGIRKVNIGDMVSPSTMITTIDQLDPNKLQFSVPESYIPVLKQGLEIQAATEAYPGEIFTGKISVVDSRVNSSTRAILVQALIPNTDGRLRPGLLMKSNIVRSQRQSLAVPEEAIVSAGEKKTVLVVGDDNKVAEAVVTTGNRQAGYVEILSGLKAGDKVIIEGLQKAHAGAEVKIAGEKTIEQTIQEAVEYSSDRKKEGFITEEAAPAAPQTELAPVETPAAEQSAPPEASPSVPAPGLESQDAAPAADEPKTE